MNGYEIYSEFGMQFFKLPDEMCILDEVFKDMATHGSAIYQPYLKKVIEGQIDSIGVGGNNAYLKINKLTTICSCEFSGCSSNEYEVETDWLYELINIWIKLNRLESSE